MTKSCLTCRWCSCKYYGTDYVACLLYVPLPTPEEKAKEEADTNEESIQK